MSRLLKAWSQDYLRRVIISLVSVFIVVPLFCLLIFVPLGIVSNSNVGQTEALLIMAVPAGLFLLLILGGGIGAVVLVIGRRARWLDDVFEPFGLKGGMYSLNGRQYHGQVNGRQVDVLFYRGPTLTIFLDTPLQTRFAVGERNKLGQAVAKALSREPVATADPALDDLNFFGLDHPWVQRLIGQEEARAAIRRLLDDSNTTFLIHQVSLQPGAFILRLYRNKGLFNYSIEQEQVHQWLADLEQLAKVAEGLPAPEQTAVESKLEGVVRRGQTTWIALAVVVLLLAPMFCLLIPAIFLIFALEGM